MGPGAALFDHDGDGDLDVFLPQGEGRSRLFRNDLTVWPPGRRTLQFTDVTDRAGITLGTYGMGSAVGDYDNDGDLDLFVTSFCIRTCCIETMGTARSPTSHGRPA